MALSEPQRVDRFWTHVDRSGECWLWMGAKHQQGYGMATGLNGRTARAHRLAWVLTNGLIPPGLLVCHSCDNPSCVLPSHLWLGTHADNMDDMRRKGRAAVGERHGYTIHPGSILRGEKNGRALLSPQQVREIRRQYVPYTRGLREKLAREYCVSIGAIEGVVRGKNWKHLPPELEADDGKGEE